MTLKELVKTFSQIFDYNFITAYPDFDNEEGAVEISLFKNKPVFTEYGWSAAGEYPLYFNDVYDLKERVNLDEYMTTHEEDDGEGYEFIDFSKCIVEVAE